MAETLTQDIGSLVVQTPGVNGGRPCLAGTGLSVLQVAAMYNEGMTPEQLVDEYPFIDLARAYAGIAYYLANQTVIDAELEAEARAFEDAVRAASRSTD